MSKSNIYVSPSCLINVLYTESYIFCMIEVADFHSSATKKSVISYGERDLNTPRGTFFFFNLRLDFSPNNHCYCLFSKFFFSLSLIRCLMITTVLPGKDKYLIYIIIFRW